jgi:hypothetical protein
MNIWANQKPKRDMEARKAFVKAKASFDDVVIALDMVDRRHDGGALAPECPFCRSVASLRQCHGGQGFYCGQCNETGDMIDLVRIVNGCIFSAAIEFLELMILPKTDDQTGELFDDQIH